MTTDSGQHDALVSTLELSLRRSAANVAPLTPQPTFTSPDLRDDENPFFGPRDKHGKPHGVGRRVYNDGSLLYMTGSFRNDEDGLQNGIYEGTFEHGNRHGPGVFHFADGRVFEGTFAEDRLSVGTLTYANGDVFTGEWRAGLKFNKGLFKYASGAKFEGYFLNDLRHGPGLVEQPDGTLVGGTYNKGRSDPRIAHTGEVDPSTGVPHGQGAMRYDDATVYEGNFVQGKCHGQGVLYYEVLPGDSERHVQYDGGWVEGLKEGAGWLRERVDCLSSGEGGSSRVWGGGLEKQQQQNQQSQQSRQQQQQQNQHRSGSVAKTKNKAAVVVGSVLYQGQFVAGKKHGEGLEVYPNGEKYQGEFRHGVRAGKGKYFYAPWSSFDSDSKLAERGGSDGRNGRGGNSDQGRSMQGRVIESAGSEIPLLRLHGLHKTHVLLPRGPEAFAALASVGELEAARKAITAAEKGEGGVVGKPAAAAAAANEAMLAVPKGRMPSSGGGVAKDVRYDGEWLDNLFHGQGLLWDLSGSKYEGTFRAGLRGGDGGGGEVSGGGENGLSGGRENGKEAAAQETVVDNGGVVDSKAPGGFGRGTEVYADGSTYEGRFKGNARCGQGTMLFGRDGAVAGKYEGSWLEGRFHGSGRREFADGGAYRGGYQKGRPHGQGTRDYAAVVKAGRRDDDDDEAKEEAQELGGGSKPYGGVHEDERVVGVFGLGGVVRYGGPWVEGQRQGIQGVETFADGSEYRGSFWNGRRHTGESGGTLRWANGDVYQGGWRLGAMEGFGRYTWHNLSAPLLLPATSSGGNVRQQSKVFKGPAKTVAVAGNSSSGGGGASDAAGLDSVSTAITAASAEKEDKALAACCDWYEGEWVEGKRQGNGRFCWGRSGDTYQGEWFGDTRSGVGTLRHGDGRVYAGPFVGGLKDTSRAEEEAVRRKAAQQAETAAAAEVLRKGALAQTNGLVSLSDPNSSYIPTSSSASSSSSSSSPSSSSSSSSSSMVGPFVSVGRQTWEDGAAYEGSWREGKMHGPKGRYLFVDGRRVEGPFKLGKPHGPNCDATTADGRFYHRGDFDSGEPVKLTKKGKRLTVLLPAPRTPLARENKVGLPEVTEVATGIP